MTLAALGATLVHFVLGEAEREVPVWRMIAATGRDRGAGQRGDRASGALEGWSIAVAARARRRRLVPC